MDRAGREGVGGIGEGIGKWGKKERGFWRSLVPLFPQQEWPLPLILQNRAEGWSWGALRLHPQQWKVSRGVCGGEAGMGDRLTHTWEGDGILAVGSPVSPPSNLGGVYRVGLHTEGAQGYSFFHFSDGILSSSNQGR